MADDFAAEMAAFDDQWEADRRSGGKLPDGKYQARVVMSRIELSSGNEKYEPRWQWALGFEDLAGAGRIRKFNNFDNEVGRRISAQDAGIMGYDGPLSGLKDACENGVFDDLIVDITVRTKAGNDDRDYTNVYINRCAGRFQGDEGGFGGTADDDIPF